MEYIYTYKIYKGSNLLKSQTNFKKIYGAFKRTYDAATGMSFDESALRSKLKNWDLYANIDFDSNGNIINQQRITFISYLNMEESGVLKINAIVGDDKKAKFDAMSRFAVNFSASPIFTAVPERLSNLFERYGMINLSTSENRNLLQAMIMFGIMPGMDNASVNKDGSVKIGMRMGDRSISVDKYLMCNAKLISFLYGYYKFGMLEYKEIPMLDVFFEKHKEDLYKKTEYKLSKDYIADQMTVSHDPDILSKGKDVDRSFFSEHLNYYDDFRFEKQYSEVKDDSFLKTNFLYVHAFGLFKTDFRVSDGVDSLNDMIRDFRSNNQKLDLSCYYVDKSKSTVKDFLNKGVPSKDKVILLIDGEVVFANTIDSKTIAEYGSEKGFEEFNEEIYKTLFWDKKSYESAKESSFEDEVGEAVIRNWSITGIIINKSGAYPNSVDTKELSMISAMNNIPVYLILEDSVASTSPDKQIIEIKEDGKDPVSLEFNDGLKAMQASIAEKTLRSKEYLIGRVDNVRSPNVFDNIINLENSKLIGKKDDETYDEDPVYSGDEEIYESSYVVNIDKEITKVYNSLENKDLNFIFDQIQNITKSSDTYLLDTAKIDNVILSKLKNTNFDKESTLEKITTFEGNFAEFELSLVKNFITNSLENESPKDADADSVLEDKLSSMKRRTYLISKIFKGF